MSNLLNRVSSSPTADSISPFLRKIRRLQKELEPLEHDWDRGVNRPLYSLYNILDDIEFSLKETLIKNKKKEV